jgi:DNA-binding transcriptional MerR regulator
MNGEADDMVGEVAPHLVSDVEDLDPRSARPKTKKSPSAFRTISEVADELHIPQHVLRFWETKFPQVKPLKRGGGRRYYRPDDITLLRRISDLLYIQGYTIKGVQRLLREGGGKLSDNIPPPTPEEREAADGASGQAMEPMLPMPGLSSPTPVRRAKTEPRAVAEHSAPAVLDPEVDRLRAVLAEVLAELEAIRATLG